MAEQIRWSASDTGLDRLNHFIEELRTYGEDMHEPLEETRDYVRLIIEEEFASQGGRSGGWAFLSEDYQVWKEHRDPGAPILMLDPSWSKGTPRMEYMIGPLLDPLSWTIDAHEAEFHPESTRAAWHQSGVPVRRDARSKKGAVTKLPPRPVLTFLEEDYQHIEDLFWDWLDKVTR